MQKIGDLKQNSTKLKENFSICRLCLQKGVEYEDLLHKNQLKIVKMIEKVFHIHVETDDCLCPKCSTILNDFLNFCEAIHELQNNFNKKKCDGNKFKEERPIELLTVTVDIKEEVFEVKEEPASDFEDISEENYAKSLHIKTDDEQNTTTESSKPRLKRTERDIAINTFFNFQCQICSYKAEHWQDLKKHTNNKHNDQNPTIACCNLQIPLERRMLLGHLEYHKNPKSLQCKFCEKQFLTLDSKRLHEYRHKVARVDGGRKYACEKVTCSVCGKILADRNSYRKHKQMHLTDEEREKLKVQCDICEKFYHGKAAIFIHMKLKHLPKNESIACDKCARVFTCSRTFRTHYRIHHIGISKVVCPDCGVEMKATSLLKHRRMRHDHVSQVCTICNKEFKNKVSLVNHQQRVHIEPKFSCDVCGRMFKLKDKWKEHREAHFNTNRFSCDQCEYVNNDYANMLKHRKTKHPNAPMIAHGTGRKVFEAR